MTDDGAISPIDSLRKEKSFATRRDPGRSHFRSTRMRFRYSLFAFKIILVVVAIIWLVEIAKRFQSDLAEFREPHDPASRIVIGGFWALSVGIGVWLAFALCDVFGRFIQLLN